MAYLQSFLHARHQAIHKFCTIIAVNSARTSKQLYMLVYQSIHHPFSLFTHQGVETDESGITILYRQNILVSLGCEG